MKRVLVTGASGSIGQWVSALLAGRGYDVVALSTADREPSEHGQWLRGDLLVAGEPAAIIERVQPSHLLHLAWYTDPRLQRGSELNLQWLQASVALVGAFGAAGGRRAAIAGTAGEYAAADSPCDEYRTPVSPATLYGTCKHALHLVAAAFAREAGFSLAWGRLFSVYGPGDRRERLIPSVAEALLDGRPAVTSEGSQKRDFIYSRDAAEAIVGLLDSDVEGPVNIGSGQPVAVRDVVAQIGRLLDGESLLRLGAMEPRASEPPLVVAAIDRLAREVGYTPTTSLEDGLPATIESLREPS
jgi:nucleoside-diphosphate-sugar epimerase